MMRFSTFAVVGVGVIAMLLGTPSTSKGQDAFESAVYPLGNRIFDRWIDNRRATHGRIIPLLIVSQYSTGSGYANGYVAPSPARLGIGTSQLGRRIGFGSYRGGAVDTSHRCGFAVRFRSVAQC